MRILCRDHDISRTCQHLLDQVSHHLFIFDEQHSLAITLRGDRDDNLLRARRN